MSEIDPSKLQKKLSIVMKEIGINGIVKLNDTGTIMLVSFDLIEAYNLFSWLKFSLQQWRRTRFLTRSRLLGDKSHPMN